jgi:protease II
MWHRGGVGGNRGKSIEDLLAVVRGLHARGIGTPESTVVEGRSAGAWLAAMAASQAPDLIASLILEAPFLDVTAATHESPLPLSKWDESEWSPNVPNLSPLNVMTDKFRAKTLTLIPIKDQLVPMSGTLEWIRRGRCATKSPDRFAIDLLKGETHEGPLTSSDEVETFALKVAFILRSIDKESQTSQDRRN